MKKINKKNLKGMIWLVAELIFLIGFVLGMWVGSMIQQANYQQQLMLRDHPLPLCWLNRSTLDCDSVNADVFMGDGVYVQENGARKDVGNFR